MGKRLFLTDNKYVAAAVADVIGVETDDTREYYENDTDMIVYCTGAVIESVRFQGYDKKLEKWEEESLPYIPKEYLYQINEKRSIQFRVIKTQLNHPEVEEIYIATSPDAEGEMQGILILMSAEWNTTAAIKRLWLRSLSKESIKKAICNAESLESFEPLMHAGFERANHDFLIQNNFSRLLSLKCGHYLTPFLTEGKKYMVLPAGNEFLYSLSAAVRHLRSNIAQSSSVLVLKLKKYPDVEIEADSNLFLSSEEEKELISNADLVADVKKGTTIVKEDAPLLFNLEDIMIVCSKELKVRPDETKNVLNRLYEKRLITYPNTRARVIKKDDKLDAIISALTKVDEVKSFAENINNNITIHDIYDTQYVTDNAIRHGAIIPTEETGAYEELAELDRKIYLLIAKRFLAIFYPAAVYTAYTYVFSVGDVEFVKEKKKLAKWGFKEVSGANDDEEDSFKEINSGERFSVEVYRREITRTENEYTVERFIRDSAKAYSMSKLGDSLQKLSSLKYIQLDKKKQTIDVTGLGECIYEVLYHLFPVILDGDLLTSWEEGIRQIEENTLDPRDFRMKSERFVLTQSQIIKEFVPDETLESRIKEIFDNQQKIKKQN